MRTRILVAALAAAAFAAAPAHAADVAGVVFNDYDGDGTRAEGEPGLAGVVVFLDLTADGLHDAAAEPWRASGPDGGWRFEGLEQGTHRVGWLPPDGGACTGGLVCAREIEAGGLLELGVQLGGLLLDTGGANAIGRARLVAPRLRCVRRPFSARVEGSGITRVVYSVDGRRAAVGAGRRFRAWITVRRLRAGRHVLTAVAAYGSDGGAPFRRLELRFRRC